jgi:hypothetical protein
MPRKRPLTLPSPPGEGEKEDILRKEDGKREESGTRGKQKEKEFPLQGERAG